MRLPIDYLILDKDLNVLKRSNKKEINSDNAINNDEVIIIEDTVEMDADFCKFYCHGKFVKYYVTRDGDVYSERKKTGKWTKQKIKLFKGNKVVFINGQRKNVSQIVAEVFLKEWYPGCYVDFKNGNKMDVFDWNLEVVTHSEYAKRTIAVLPNTHSMRKVGLYENNQLVREFESLVQAGRELYISYDTVKATLKHEQKNPLFDLRYLD